MTDHSHPLYDSVKDFPQSPGIYRMWSEDDEVLYVGKAKALRKRVLQYFGRELEQRYQIRFLMKRVVRIDCIVTDNEQEALILENNLIKKYKPRYNIDLRDDKTHPSLKLSIKDRWPRLYYTRKVRQDGSLYFGPFPSAYNARHLLELVEKYFQLRTCSDRELASRTRPCIEYQMKRCSAPCVDKISYGDYAQIVTQVKQLLQGKDKDLAAEITASMQQASEELRFEDAAELRDKLEAIQSTLESQHVFSHRGEERDVIGYYREGESGMIGVLPIRRGKVDEGFWIPFKDIAEDYEVMESFLLQYYDEQRYLPGELYVPLNLPHLQLVQQTLSERREQKVILKRPQRGSGVDLVRLAMINAEEAFKRRAGKDEDRRQALSTLQRKLQLGAFPHTIECFDISNIQGRQPVASMVRFTDGEPDKAFYRRFKIKNLPETPNDYAMMREVLQRRLARAHSPEANRDVREAARWKLPDLLVVDGGKGQLNIAIEVTKELGIHVPLCTVTKPHGDEETDKVYLPKRMNPVTFRKNDSALHVLQFLRDEAHRFAISFHRELREKKLRQSPLDKIPGIGPQKKRALLKHFGSLQKVRAADIAELIQVAGITPQLAEQIQRNL